MNILDYLNIPLCQPQRIPVKTLVEQLQPTSTDKRLIESHIASIHLVSLLNEQTIRIRSYVDENYSFQAIYVFKIELKQNDSLTELSYLVHSAFPESTILTLSYKDKNYISCAMKRINKLDNTKTVIKDLVITEVKDKHLQYLSLKAMNGFNLKEYYQNIVKLLYKLKVLAVTNVFSTKDMDYVEVIKQYERLNADINKLKLDYKNASMKSEKMRIDDELFDKEEELKMLTKRLKE